MVNCNLLLNILNTFNNLLSKISSHREEGISLPDYRNPTWKPSPSRFKPKENNIYYR